MADESLLGVLGNNDLTTFQNSLLQSNPYGLAAQGLAGAKFDTSTWSPTETAATSFGKAFLQGILGRYAQQDAAEQTNKVLAVLPQLAQDPASVATPEGVDESAFSTLRANSAIKKQLAIADLLQRTGIAKATAKSDVLGKIEGYTEAGAGAASVPGTPQYENKKAQLEAAKLISGEEDSARTELLTGAKYPAVNKLNTTSTALSQLKPLKDINTASSDIPFATLFLQGLDGSVVKEGEYARVQGANPFIAKFKNQLEGALNGTSTLGVDIKRQMYNELSKTQSALFEAAKAEAAPRIATAVSRGANPKNIWSPTIESPSASQSPITVAPDGKKYVFID